MIDTTRSWYAQRLISLDDRCYARDCQVYFRRMWYFFQQAELFVLLIL